MRTTPFVRLSFAAFVLATSARGQAQLDWIAAHDGPTSKDDFGSACAVDPSGAVYVAGTSATTDVAGGVSADGVLTKFSSTGAVEWTQSWDHFGYYDGVGDVAIAPTGDVYVSGVSQNTHGKHPTLRKYSSAGAPQWAVHFYSPQVTSASANKIAFDASGNVIVAGVLQGTALLMSYSPAGVLNWSRSVVGGFGGNSMADVVVTAQNEIVACGRKGTNFNGAMAVFKYSDAGVLLWQTFVEETVEQASIAYALALTGTGKIVAVGDRDVLTSSDSMAAQIDLATGAVDWVLYHDAGAHLWDELRRVAVDGTGAIWAAGREGDTSPQVDVQTLRIAPDGQLLSSSIWNGIADEHDQATGLVLGSAGQAWVIVLSKGPPDRVVLLEYDSHGALDWQRSYGMSDLSNDFATDAARAPNGRIALCGSSDGSGSGNYDLLALQIDVSDSPSVYCTPKVNSLGCTPRLTFVGQSSASSSIGFEIICDRVRNQRNGMLIYSVHGAAAIPFQGAFLCVQPPTRRTPMRNSAGSASGDDCSGVFALGMNAFAAGAPGFNPAPELSVAGADVFCQWWSRDPGAPGDTGLSSGLRYTVLP